MVLRTDAPLGPLEREVRRAVTDVNADVPVPDLRVQTEIMAETSSKEIAFTQILSLFGGFALLLASIGLYGVTSYWVTRRTNEIGIRLAVGALPREILRLVLRQMVILASAGLLLGLPTAIGAGSLVENLLYGVTATDPKTIALVAGVVLVVAVGAGLAPAVRAAKLDALVALRTE